MLKCWNIANKTWYMRWTPSLILVQAQHIHIHILYHLLLWIAIPHNLTKKWKINEIKNGRDTVLYHVYIPHPPIIYRPYQISIIWWVPCSKCTHPFHSKIITHTHTHTYKLIPIRNTQNNALTILITWCSYCIFSLA